MTRHSLAGLELIPFHEDQRKTRINLEDIKRTNTSLKTHLMKPLPKEN